MVSRDSKGKPLKKTTQATRNREIKWLAKLQAESLKVHGDPLNTPKVRNAKAKKKGN
jgi:hypothetical protein